MTTATLYRVDRTGTNASCGHLVYARPPYTHDDEPAERRVVCMRVRLPDHVTLFAGADVGDSVQAAINGHGCEMHYYETSRSIAFVDVNRDPLLFVAVEEEHQYA